MQQKWAFLAELDSVDQSWLHFALFSAYQAQRCRTPSLFSDPLCCMDYAKRVSFVIQDEHTIKQVLQTPGTIVQTCDLAGMGALPTCCLGSKSALLSVSAVL